VRDGVDLEEAEGGDAMGGSSVWEKERRRKKEKGPGGPLYV
jgi:hypothetical protein